MHEVSGIAVVGWSQGAWNPPKLYHFTQLELYYSARYSDILSQIYPLLTTRMKSQNESNVATIWFGTGIHISTCGDNYRLLSKEFSMVMQFEGSDAPRNGTCAGAVWEWGMYLGDKARVDAYRNEMGVRCWGGVYGSEVYGNEEEWGTEWEALYGMRLRRRAWEMEW